MAAISNDERIDRYVESDPLDRGPDEAVVRGFGVPIWALVGHSRTTGTGLDQVALDYDLPLEAVRSAFAYYEHHQEVIDARIAANAA